jgi:hypothetical protein
MTYLLHISFDYRFILIVALYNPILAWSLSFFAHKMRVPVAKMLKKFLVPAPHKVSRQKKVSRRGGGFTKDEGNVLCSTFLNVSGDPITTTGCYLFI